jgi:hypothetical protein
MKRVRGGEFAFDEQSRMIHKNCKYSWSKKHRTV